MTWTTNPYCTQDQVYRALDLSTSAQAKDGAWIQELIEEAQTAVDERLGFSFQQDGTQASPSTRVYDGNDLEKLWIPVERILSITQVLETTYLISLGSNGSFISGTPQTVDITADVQLGPNNARNGYYVMKRKTPGSVFAEGTANYQVSGVFGRPSIPADITRACVRIVVHWYKMRDTAYSDMLNDQGGVKQHYKKTLPDDVMETICKYTPRLFLA